MSESPPAAHSYNSRSPAGVPASNGALLLSTMWLRSGVAPWNSGPQTSVVHSPPSSPPNGTKGSAVSLE